MYAREEPIYSRLRKKTNAGIFVGWRSVILPLIRHERLDVYTFQPVEAQISHHRPVIEAIQVDRVTVGEMLVSMPRRDAECVSLLPGQGRLADDGMPAAGDDVVYRRGRLSHGGGGGAGVEALCRSAEDFGDCSVEKRVSER